MSKDNQLIVLWKTLSKVHAKNVTSHPWFHFGFVAIIVIISALGNRFSVTDSDVMIWIPEGTRGMTIDNKYNVLFPDTESAIVFYSIPRSESVSNILTKDGITGTYEYLTELAQRSIDLDNDAVLTLSDVCLTVRTGDQPCFVTPSDPWDTNATAVALDSDPVNTLLSFYADNNIEPSIHFADFDGNLMTASALALTVPLGDKVNSSQLEEFVYKLYHSVSDDVEGPRFLAFSMIVMERELEESVSDGSANISLGFTCVSIILGLFLGTFKRFWVSSRLMLAMFELGCIGMSIGAGLGITAFMNITFTSLTSVNSFLLLALGADEALLMTHSVSQSVDDLRADKGRRLTEEELRHVFNQGLQHALPSVLVTSLTDISAFVVGSYFSSIPSITWFCASAACCCSVSWFVHTFLFPVFLWWDTIRENECKNSLLVCISHQEPDYSKKEVDHRRFISKFWDFWTNLISNPVCRVLIILLAVVFSTYGALNVSGLSRSTPMWKLVPAGDTQDAFKLMTHQAQNMSLPVVFHNLYPSKEFYSTYQQFFIDLFNESSEYFTGFDSNGDILALLLQYANSNSSLTDCLDDGFWKDRDCFISIFNSALNNPSLSQLVSDNIIVENVTDSTSQLVFQSFTRTTEISDAMSPTFTTYCYDLIDSWSTRYNFDQFSIASHDPDVFVYSSTFVYAHQSLEIPTLLATTLSFALVCVAIFISLFAHWTYSILLIAGLAIIDLVLFCIMVIASEPLADIQTICLLISIGISVDYALHLVLAFAHSDGPTKQRLNHAFQIAGSAVFFGGFSTFLALSPLLLVQTDILRTFGRLFGYIISAAMFVALMVIPATLSFLPDKPESNGTGDASNSSSKIPMESPQTRPTPSQSA